MEILAIFNAKGGVGKTTTAVNLATCLAALGHSVVVFDLDAQGNATASLGCKHPPKIGSYDVIVGQASIRDAMAPTFIDRVSLVGATKNLATVDLDLTLGEDKGDIIREVIQPIADKADILILDCAPTFGAMTINALVSANAVLIPSQPSSYAHEGLLRTWSVLSRIRTELEPGLKTLGILPTFIDGSGEAETNGDSSGDLLAAMRAEFGNLVHPDGIPADALLFDTASAVGLPACIVAPQAPASFAYLELAGALTASTTTSVFRRLDDPSAPNGDSLQTAHATLSDWHKAAEEAGMLADMVNIPAVDGRAMTQATNAEINPFHIDHGTQHLNASRMVMTVGIALFMGVAGFLVGWLANSGGL